MRESCASAIQSGIPGPKEDPGKDARDETGQ